MTTPQSRLLKLADEAVADYNATHAAGGEAVYPSWVEDVRLLCNAAPSVATAGNPQPARDWELTCHECDGSGHVFVERQVAERKTDVQEFKEECDCCEGRGFTIAFEDIPGIAEYVKSCRPAPDAPLASMARAIFGDQIGGQMDAMAGTPAPSAPGDAQNERQAFEAWAKERGYQSDELARCKLGIVSPEYFNLNTENAWKAWQARASVAAPAAGDALDLNHRPDLHYILGVLDRLAKAAPKDQELAAALNGMRYVVSRTDAAIAAQRKGDA